MYKYNKMPGEFIAMICFGVFIIFTMGITIFCSSNEQRVIPKKRKA